MLKLASWAGMGIRCTCNCASSSKSHKAYSSSGRSSAIEEGVDTAGFILSEVGDAQQANYGSSSKVTLDDISVEENKGRSVPFFNSSIVDHQQVLKNSLKSIQQIRRHRPHQSRSAYGGEEKRHSDGHHREFRPQTSPNLPIVSRERNWLLSRLRQLLFFTDKAEWDQEKVWNALTELMEYPDHVPNLPRSKSFVPIRSGDDGNLEHQRRRIHLSERELRKLFEILAAERPRTQKGFNRLLIVTNLIAHGVAEGPRDELTTSYSPVYGNNIIPQVEMGSRGLRERDWQDLIAFAGMNTRRPRYDLEMASGISLYSQFSKAFSTEVAAASTSLSMYNILLQMALKSRHYDAVNHLRERMAQEGVNEDHVTALLHMNKAVTAGESPKDVWRMFVRVVSLFRAKTSSDEGKAKLIAKETVAWNSMMWILAKSGEFEEAMKIYQAMRNGKEVNLLAFSSPAGSQETGMTGHDSFLVTPPEPSRSTYTSLIQAYAFQGHLHEALRILDNMIEPRIRESSGKVDPGTNPDPTIYTSLFKGFARHGIEPSVWERESAQAKDPVALNFGAVRQLLKEGEAQSHILSSALIDQPSSIGSERQPAKHSSPWTLEALKALFSAFLSLRPPSESAESEQLSGQTAPSAKQLFWLILAFDKLSGGNSQIIIKVWEAIENKFDATRSKDSRSHGRHEHWKGYTGAVGNRRLETTLSFHAQKALQK